MKKIILTITVAAFAIGAFAGENCCPKAKAACASKEKAGATCSAAKGKCGEKCTGKIRVESPRGADARKS